MINKGFCSFDNLHDGLDSYPDGTIVIWKDMKYILETSDDAYSKMFNVRSIGLEPTNEKFVMLKRNEKCFCGSDKKFKKCCINKMRRN